MTVSTDLELDERRDGDHALPVSVENLSGAILTGLLAFALAAMPLAMLSAFRPIPVLLFALTLWVALFAMWGPERGLLPTSTGSVRRASAAALLIVLLATVVNVRFSAQHVLSNRDPGVYNTTARWLADTGEVLVDDDEAPFRELAADGVRASASGYHPRADGKLYPQFMHLLPAMIGATAWLGGSRGMLKVNAILGGVALLMLFMLASKLITPWWAVAVVAVLALNFPQMHFTRDAYSEILTQVFVLGGVGTLASRWDALRPGRVMIAGLSIGAASMARIDGWIYFVPLAVLMLWMAAALARGITRDRLARLLGLFAAGAALPAVIAWLDARYFSFPYLSVQWKNLRHVWTALVATALAGVLVAASHRVAPQLADWVRRRRVLLGGMGVVLIVSGAAYGYLLRPHVEAHRLAEPNALVEALQRAQGLAVDGRRTYAELSLRWIALYVGLPALVFGVVGYAVMCRRVIVGALDRAIPFVLFMFAPTALYVWQHKITPDHLWAMRRFLPLTIPGLLLCSFWMLRLVMDWVPAAYKRVGHLGIGAVVGMSLAFPAWTVAPVFEERTQLGVLHATQQFCRALPTNAAVLVAQSEGADRNFVPTVRSFCRVPVASGPSDRPLSWYQGLAARWAQDGRSLWLASYGLPFGPHVPAEHGVLISSAEVRNLELRLNRRPSALRESQFTLYLTRVGVP